MDYDHEDFIERLEKTRNREIVERTVRDLGNDTALTIDVLPDHDADLSFLGRYDNEMREYTVDRKEGRYYGEYRTTVFEMLLKPSDFDDEQLVDPQAIEAGLGDIAIASGWDLIDECTESSFDWSFDTMRAWIDVSGYKILAGYLGNRWEHNEYRYFHPEVGGEDDPDMIRYAVEDYKQYERLNSGSDFVNGVEVTLYIQGEEIDSESCWGIIDGDDKHFAEIAAENLYEIMARLPETLANLREVAEMKAAKIDAINATTVQGAAAIMLLATRDHDYTWKGDGNDYTAEASRYQ